MSDSTKTSFTRIPLLECMSRHIPRVHNFGIEGGDVSSITVVIPTLNEARHIERAVSSASTLGSVFIVDSGSSDKTIPLAMRLGASTVFHPWSGYSDQKNWA